MAPAVAVVPTTPQNFPLQLPLPLHFFSHFHSQAANQCKAVAQGPPVLPVDNDGLLVAIAAAIARAMAVAVA
jgi:hypothetical protein